MGAIFIYDNDGTLTPYSLPQYQVLKDCGYDSQLRNYINKHIMYKEAALSSTSYSEDGMEL